VSLSGTAMSEFATIEVTQRPKFLARLSTVRLAITETKARVANLLMSDHCLGPSGSHARSLFDTESAQLAAISQTLLIVSTKNSEEMFRRNAASLKVMEYCGPSFASYEPVKFLISPVEIYRDEKAGDGSYGR
jgi:hypothetical protein